MAEQTSAAPAANLARWLQSCQDLSDTNRYKKRPLVRGRLPSSGHYPTTNSTKPIATNAKPTANRPTNNFIFLIFICRILPLCS